MHSYYNLDPDKSRICCKFSGCVQRPSWVHLLCQFRTSTPPCRSDPTEAFCAEAIIMTVAGWFEWALRVNTTNKGDNVWGFAQCYELGYLKYADLYGVPS